MTITQTLLAMGLTAAAFALCAWRGGRPSNPLKPRMIPWTLLAILVGAGFLFLLAHLFGHFGLETGGGMRR